MITEKINELRAELFNVREFSECFLVQWVPCDNINIMKKGEPRFVLYLTWASGRKSKFKFKSMKAMNVFTKELLDLPK